jgi:hypothetical protein
LWRAGFDRGWHVGSTDGLLETAIHVFVEDSGDYYTISDGLPQRADGNPGIMIAAD